MKTLEQKLVNERLTALTTMREINDTNMLRASNQIAHAENLVEELKRAMVRLIYINLNQRNSYGYR